MLRLREFAAAGKIAGEPKSRRLGGQGGPETIPQYSGLDTQ
jgi:hypothetical protein